MSDYGDYDVRKRCPPHLLEAIRHPHSHEGPNNRPLWIIWKKTVGHDGIPDGPHIDSIADTEDSAIAHVGMVYESYGNAGYAKELHVIVERIPANHRFASSIEEHFTDGRLAKVRAGKTTMPNFYRRTGD